MKQEFDIVIVSAYGRGQWLAAELKDQDFNVCLVDISESLGRWAPEDWEGPFGLFHGDNVSQNQWGRLSAEDYSDPNAEGFTVWLKHGPLDFMGPVTQFWLSQDGPMEAVRKYLNAWDEVQTNSGKRALREKAMAGSFEQNWLIHLSHQLASSVYSPNATSAAEATPLPLFSPWSTRRPTRKGYTKSLEWCASKGVEVIGKAQLKDLSIELGHLKSVEVTSERLSGAVMGKSFIWLLSSLETQAVLSHAYPQLFATEPVVPEWFWVRYRVQMDLGDYRQTLPQHFLIIKDLALPWSHDNLIMVQRTVNDKDFDLWCRIPNHHRFHRVYLDEIAQDLIEVLRSKIPGIQPELAEKPQEYSYEYGELGPSLFPVFEKTELKSLRRVHLKNIIFGGSERMPRLDWTGRFESDWEILRENLLWQERQKKKEDESDREVHAP